MLGLKVGNLIAGSHHQERICIRVVEWLETFLGEGVMHDAQHETTRFRVP